MPKIVDWLKKSGMLENVYKREASLFETKKLEPKAVNVMGENILVAPSVKILGLTFSSDLSWHAHIEKNHQSIQKDSHTIKLLGQYLDE